MGKPGKLSHLTSDSLARLLVDNGGVRRCAESLGVNRRSLYDAIIRLNVPIPARKLKGRKEHNRKYWSTLPRTKINEYNGKKYYGDLWEAHRVFLDTQRKLKKEGLV